MQENCKLKAVGKGKNFAIVTITCYDVPAKFAQEVESSLIERTMRLNGYWVKGVLPLLLLLLLLLILLLFNILDIIYLIAHL